MLNEEHFDTDEDVHEWNDGTNSPLSKMELVMRQKEHEMLRSASTCENNIEFKLKEYAKTKRIKSDANVFEYWATQKLRNEELYQLSTITNSVPIT